jgi:SAM-dependent methyltransferase
VADAREPVRPLFRPYSLLAPAYDETIGIPAFHRARRAFEALARRYGIVFRSAADLGCGTGLFARYLSGTWGIPVVAVDISWQMLRIAARNCRGLPVRLLHQDIRGLRLPAPVDLVTSNFDTLNHLVGDGELLDAFRRIHESLRPGGHLFFDVVTPCLPFRGARVQLRRLPTDRLELWQRVRWDARRRLVSIHAIVRSPASPRVAVEVLRERMYSPAEIGRWLSQAGFVVRGVHDAETIRPAVGCPQRIVVVSQKRAAARAGAPP